MKPWASNVMKRGLTPVLLLALLVSGCDVVTTTYPTYNDAKGRELFAKGWLPDIIPASSKSIRTSNDLDVNTSEGEFYFDPKDAARFASKLKPYTKGGDPFVDFEKRVRKMEADGYTAYKYSAEDTVWVFFCDSKKGHCFYDMWLVRRPSRE